MSSRSFVNEPPQPEALTAAIAISRPPKPKSLGGIGRQAIAKDWQREIYDALDRVGELHFGVTWMANAISKVKLKIQYEDGENLRDVKDDKGLLKQFFGSRQQQSEMLRDIAYNWESVGECWLLYNRTTEKTDVVSVLEVTGDDLSGYYITRDRALTQVKQENDEDLIRIYRRDPGRRFEATSSVKAARDALREILLMNAHIKRQATSRIAAAGMLLAPNEISMKTEEGETVADAIQMMLGTAAEIAAAHPDDISATSVPIVFSAPGAYLDKFSVLKFWSDLDDKALDIRRDAIRRLALALEMPPEVLLGTSGMNRWSTWALDESSIKASIEPLANAIAAALTQGVLMLADVARDQGWIITADTSELRLRPNRGREAIELWDRGILSEFAVRRENGFSTVNDTPTEEDIKRWALLQMAKGSFSPVQSQAAIKELGVDLDVDLSQLPALQGRPDRSLKEHEDRPTDSLSAERLAMSVLAARAVEKAGARLKTLTKNSRQAIAASSAHCEINVPSSMLDDLLLHAWDSVDTFIQEDRDNLVASADNYVRGILISGVEFNLNDCLEALNG